jgi:hypothetical protein
MVNRGTEPHAVRHGNWHRVVNPSLEMGIQSKDAKPPPRKPRLYLVYPVQYVPNLAKDEFMTIGFLAYDPQSHLVVSRFKFDIEAVKKLHPLADEDYLKDLPAEFDRQIRLHQTNPEEFLAAAKSFSNLVQLAQPKFCWLDDLEAEVERIL